MRSLLEMFYDISSSLTLGPTLEDVLQEMFEKIKEQTGISSILIWVLDEKKEFFDLASYCHLPQAMIDIFKARRLKRNEGTPGMVLKTKKFYLMEDILTDPYSVPKYVETVIKSKAPIRGILSFPMIIRDEAIGVFSFFFAVPRESISRIEFIIFSTIANQIASFIQNTAIVAEMRREKNKISTVINNFADGLIVFDEEWRLSLINPRAKEIFSIESKDAIGKKFSEVDAFSVLKPAIILTKGSNNKFSKKEIQVQKDLILEVGAVPMLAGENNLGVLLILHDITREKMVERMKTEFVSLAAHQLRTPLSAIKWTLKMLLERDLGEISKEQEEYINRTYQSNERMIVLINDLLDVTRIEEGRYLYKLSSSNLEDIIRFAVDSSKEEIQKKKIQFEFIKPKKRSPELMLDVEKIRLAVQNLLDNAIRYTPAGGKVSISIKLVGKEIEVQIQDAGVGIPRNQQKRVFSKFFRADNVIKIETEGSGLGLFIAKNIIEAHGGRIRFESKENKGSTFYFTLPIK